MEPVYLCIDLKTFYASVECVIRGLDPFETNLVVADPSRGEGGICLAISPKMKQLGVKNRCRLYEISKEISYITAIPRMELYMQYAADIYGIYLKYIAKEDIHIYSIDEAFFDLTQYLSLYEMEAVEIARMLMADVYAQTGITAVGGLGTNLYLAKVALDLCAKHTEEGIYFLDEQKYQKTLWHHRPLQDFWMVGKGISKRLEKYGIYDMFGVAHCPKRLLYQEFGINAQYLIDHAWGKEPTTMQEIKQYQPKHNSLSNSQILFEDYSYEDALLVLKEMVETNVLGLVERHLVTNHISLQVGYSKKEASATGGSRKLERTTNSLQFLMKQFLSLFQSTTHKEHKIRQISIGFGNVCDEIYETYDLFTDVEALEKEKCLQQTLVEIKHKYGKNAVVKGMNLLDKATGIRRNRLIGGHNAK